jgi:glutathione S-transferase
MQPTPVPKKTEKSHGLSTVTLISCIGSCVMQRLVVPLMGGVPDEEVVAEAVPLATASVEALEALIDGNEFFAGDKISLADLHVIPIYDFFSQTPEGEVALGGTPNLRSWWNAISQRESVQKTKPVLG